MKFMCRYPYQERQEYERYKMRMKLRALQNYHRVFAWLPVRVSYNDCRWLEFVERRYPVENGVFVGDPEYRSLRKEFL